MLHSDYVSKYIQLGEVLKSLSIHPQSFEISKQNFLDSPIIEHISSGVKYIRARLGARGKSSCSMIQTCQVNWTITILANTLAIQLIKTAVVLDTPAKLNIRTNFNGKEDPTADWTTYMSQTAQGYFDATTLWGSAIYAREQAVISGNSLSDLCTKNGVSVPLIESIIEGKRHCGEFIHIPLAKIDRHATTKTAATPFYYKIPQDITFSGVLDLNQLNHIFNSFHVLTRNYATLHLQLYIQDFLQDLKVVLVNKNDTVQNNHLVYHMIPPEKPEIVYLLAGDDATGLEYLRYNARIVNMQNAAIDDQIPQNSINKIGNAKFDILEIQNVCFKIANEEAIITEVMLLKHFILTNIFLHGNWILMIHLREDITLQRQNLNDFKQFIGTGAYPDPNKAYITPMMHYLCDAFARIIFDHISMPQVLNIDVIGELADGAIKSQ
ncbi:MAG: hypothetical protein EZS28_000908 [Streblomastix strix]|uniref:Uncharacterized protein n=1 Tax=Streblomastix strix TaxID=222440 RepID=A0A5J4X9K1_9EUKA|nr:MAG: hypothetical protein EZS28_000908 [Streblomastix strix]